MIRKFVSDTLFKVGRAAIDAADNLTSTKNLREQLAEQTANVDRLRRENDKLRAERDTKAN